VPEENSPASAIEAQRRYLRRAARILIPLMILLIVTFLVLVAAHNQSAGFVLWAAILLTLGWNCWFYLVYRPRLRRQFPD